MKMVLFSVIPLLKYAPSYHPEIAKYFELWLFVTKKNEFFVIKNKSSTHRSHLQGPSGCPETSVRNYHYSLRNNPVGRSFHLLRDGSLKSQIFDTVCNQNENPKRDGVSDMATRYEVDGSGFELRWYRFSCPAIKRRRLGVNHPHPIQHRGQRNSRALLPSGSSQFVTGRPLPSFKGKHTTNYY
jgi:hypothetical protein